MRIIRLMQMLSLLCLMLLLAACQQLNVVWEPYRIPAEVDTYTLQGLELTEEIRIIEGEPTLFLQLAVTETVTVETLEAHYAHYDYEDTLSSDRRSELESMADDLNADNSLRSLRVPVDTQYTPTDGERDVIGSYMLPLGQPDPNRLIGYRVEVTLSNPADSFSNGKLIRVDNGAVYRPRD